MSSHNEASPHHPSGTGSGGNLQRDAKYDALRDRLAALELHTGKLDEVRACDCVHAGVARGGNGGCRCLCRCFVQLMRSTTKRLEELAVDACHNKVQWDAVVRSLSTSSTATPSLPRTHSSGFGQATAPTASPYPSGHDASGGYSVRATGLSRCDIMAGDGAVACSAPGVTLSFSTGSSKPTGPSRRASSAFQHEESKSDAAGPRSVPIGHVHRDEPSRYDDIRMRVESSIHEEVQQRLHAAGCGTGCACHTGR